jgi:GDP-4-dehydro-6-deoxy-D-mannose reductase
MTARVLITGGEGFVGRWLIEALAKRLPQGSAVSTGEGRRIDVTDAAATAAWIGDFAPTAVVHLAAVASPRDAMSRPERAWAVNVLGTAHVCEAVRRKAPGARLIFASSSEVYGAAFRDRAVPLDEDVAPQPLSVYAATKAAAEAAVLQLGRDGVRTVVMRPFNHTGPGQSPTYVIPSFAMQIAEIESGLKPPRMAVGNLDARRDLLDVRDVVEAYAAACLADAPAPPPGIVNIASGHSHRIGDLLDRLRRMARVGIEVTTDPALLRPNDIAVTAGDSARATRWLGWSPRIDIDATLADVLEDCRSRVAARRSD